MKEDYYYKNLYKSFTSIEGLVNGYKIVATKKFVVGEVIEECPVVKTDTQFVDVLKDHKLINATISSDEEKMNICLVSGNYVLYNQSINNNAVSQYDARFSVLTVRAIKEINIGDEIVLPSIEVEPDKDAKMSKPKSGGCGCGKKKNAKPAKTTPTNKEESKTEIDNKNSNESSEFKSMVTGKNLKSIKVD